MNETADSADERAEPLATHPAAWEESALAQECDVTFTRRSGPGGQHRNKVETAVVVVHRPTGVQAEANERRSQAENRKEAVFRLRIKLALAVRTTPAEVGPSPLWLSRLKGERLEVSDTHTDFPALLAEALDVLAHTQGDAAVSGERLHCTSSQLVKLLRKQHPALTLVNRWRTDSGRKPLK